MARRNADIPEVLVPINEVAVKTGYPTKQSGRTGTRSAGSLGPDPVRFGRAEPPRFSTSSSQRYDMRSENSSTTASNPVVSARATIAGGETSAKSAQHSQSFFMRDR
jgi:hypothetical protein